MFHRMNRPTRILLAIVGVCFSLALFFGVAAQRVPGASAHQAVAFTDVEDNDIPTGSYTNHDIHLHPAGQPLNGIITFSVSGHGLPDLTKLSFRSDFNTGAVPSRCAGDTIDAAVVTTDNFGNFATGPFTATGCVTGQYFIEATDGHHVWNAFLSLT